MEKSRITRKMEELKNRNEKALICYVTAGDPSLEDTKTLVGVMEKAGADVVELGIPYSDPLADGPVIQRAAKRALDAGTHVEDVFETVEAIRKTSQVPLAFLLYYNSMLRYGVEKFLDRCKEAGVDGLIIADLPLEERRDMDQMLAERTMDLIPLVAPTSKDRIEKIVDGARGFVYCVSSLGVTGTRTSFSEDLQSLLDGVKEKTSVSRAIGFGISGPQAIRDLGDRAEGFIVGSAIIKELEKGLEDGTHIQKVAKFVEELKAAAR